jgi:hypothetical protein
MKVMKVEQAFSEVLVRRRDWRVIKTFLSPTDT